MAGNIQVCVVEAALGFAFSVAWEKVYFDVVVVLDVVLDYPGNCATKCDYYVIRALLPMAEGWDDTPIIPSTCPVELKKC